MKHQLFKQIDKLFDYRFVVFLADRLPPVMGLYRLLESYEQEPCARCKHKRKDHKNHTSVCSICSIPLCDTFIEVKDYTSRMKDDWDLRLTLKYQKDVRELQENEERLTRQFRAQRDRQRKRIAKYRSKQEQRWLVPATFRVIEILTNEFTNPENRITEKVILQGSSDDLSRKHPPSKIWEADSLKHHEIEEGYVRWDYRFERQLKNGEWEQCPDPRHRRFVTPEFQEMEWETDQYNRFKFPGDYLEDDYDDEWDY